MPRPWEVGAVPSVTDDASPWTPRGSEPTAKKGVRERGTAKESILLLKGGGGGGGKGGGF